MGSNRCPQCAGPLVEIEMVVRERLITMRSCNPCDRRWWDADGDGVELPQVLELARR